MNPTDVANRYFASVRTRDIDAFMALFAEDATLMLPDGRAIVGAAAIRKMETAVFAAGSPMPTPTTMVASVDAIAVQIDVRLPDGSLLKMANFYHLDGEGRIKQLSVYRQGTVK